MPTTTNNMNKNMNNHEAEPEGHRKTRDALRAYYAARFRSHLNLPAVGQLLAGTPVRMQ